MLNPQIAIQKNVSWVKRKLGDSPDETAFFRWPLQRLLERTGFRDVRIDPFDFLHPKTPRLLVSRLNALGRFLENMPVILRRRETGALVQRFVFPTSQGAPSAYIDSKVDRSGTAVTRMVLWDCGRSDADQ
jgi:hypothetical protein